MSAAEAAPVSTAQVGVSVSPLASAAQPAAGDPAYQTLNLHLSKQASKIAQFKVVVFEPWIYTTSYEWESNTRETTAWRCI